METILEKAGLKSPSFDTWFKRRYTKKGIVVPPDVIVAMRSSWAGCNRLWKERVHKYITKGG